VKKIEIPRPEWGGRLNEIGRKHDGWLVSLEIAMPQSHAVQREFREMPLVGITAEPTDGGTISIAVEEAGGAHLTHIIHAPTHVFIETTKAGADNALEIDRADGTRAVLRFRSGRAA
jgi:hypothetical protein